MKLNAKVRKLALKRSFSDLVCSDSVVVVDDFVLETPKTKGAVAAFKAVNAQGKVVCMVDEYTENAILATGNIQTVFLTKASCVNTFQIVWADKLVFTKAALDAFIKRIS